MQPRNSISINASQTLTHKSRGGKKNTTPHKKAALSARDRELFQPLFFILDRVSKLWIFGLKIWFEYIFLSFRYTFAFLLQEKHGEMKKR